MLMVLFSWIIICGAALLFGKAITDSVYKDRRETMGCPDIYIMTGIIFLNVYAQLFSLFYKVAGIACTILGTMGIVLFCVWAYRQVRRGKAYGIFPGCTWEKPDYRRVAALLFCFALTLVWTTRSPGQYDTGLYHAQAIRWVEEYGVVPGLGNLHMRLAYNSAFMSLQALFSLGWLLGQSLHTLNGFFCLAALFYALSTVRLWGEKSRRTSDFLKCVAVFYVVQKCHDIASSGTDIEAMLLMLYIFIKWSEYMEREEKDGVLYGYLCLVSVYAATVKLSAASTALLALYPLYLFIREKNGKAIFSHVAAGVGILLPFLIRNVVISGYLVYPYAGLDLFHPDWKMDEAVLLSDSLDIKMFARGLRSAAEYDNSLIGWIPKWFVNQNAGNRVLIVVGAVCVPVILYLFGKNLKERNYVRAVFFGTGVLNLFFWFFTAPHMRYGEPYIYVLVAMALGAAAGVAKKKAAGAIGAAATFAVAVFLVQYGAGLSKLSELETKHWIRQPDYLAWPAERYQIQNVEIWAPEEGDLIGYFVFPATSQKKQLKTLELRGESFREGFRHE